MVLGFRLSITKGLQQGKELTFEQAEVKIGRTSENHLVLLDHGVSRRHARIFERAGKCFAADVGSSNGTLLNGEPLEGEQPLRDGDRLGVGTVELTFAQLPADDITDPDATRIREHPMAAAATIQEMPRVELPPTGKLPAVAASRPEPKALEKSPARAEPEATVPSAAERARRRRELSGSRGGQLALWFNQLPLKTRAAVGVGTLSVVLGSLVALAYVFWPEAGPGAKGPEPVALGRDAVTDSFGLGEGVTWENEDLKEFDFEFVTPTRAVAVLHYQAAGISKEEVSLTLNGANLGWLPPDTNTERGLEHILPPGALKRGEQNTLVFDNVKNPPGADSWRVWNLRLEIIPVPELPPEELLAKAREYATEGADLYARKDIGAENLFRAWRQLRFAWITLEAVDPKPELYHDVRYQLGQVAAELDQKCGQLMLDFQRSLQVRSRKKAKAALAEVGRRFPTAEHRCHNLGLQKAYEYEL
ncbi:MAG TPA: FHA domain-containing protein [Myxococcus sp.]|nr:FHA domain-containing protein [Myxococcus sp.]